MSHFAQKVFGSMSSSGGSGGPAAAHHFILRQISQDESITDVFPNDHAHDTSAMYSIESRKKKITVYRGEVNPQHIVGECKTAFMGLSMDLSLRGQQFSIRNSMTGTKFVVESPSYGRLEWKGDSLLGSGLSLYKGSGEKIATVKSGGILNHREKQLLVFVPCDGYYAEMVLLTAVAALKLDKRADELAYKLLSD
jgi:hypothetical protein